MQRIIVVGLSHKTAPVEIRERLSFNQEAIESGLSMLSSKKHIEECMIISTCNRVEIYAVSENADICVESVKEFLSEFHSISQDDFSPYLYISIGHMAVRHFYKVASGIDSMIVGEPQILGQLKQAYKTAALKATAGLILNRLSHSAFFVAKRVRTETGIGSKAVSVSYVAVELAKRIFDELTRRKVLLVGSGEMAELAARNLIKAGVGDLIIASKHFENASMLAERLSGRPIMFEEVFYSLKDVDIVITATGSSEFIIKPQHVKEALKLRNNEPMFMIDIAVPRDIDPRVGELADIYLYDIDDLKNVLDENIKTRKDNAERAEEIVMEIERAFQAWINSLKVVPAIIDLKKRFEQIQKSEVDRALAKLENYSDKERDVIRLMASRIISKILHGPLTNLKKEASTSLGALYVDSVKKLFELETEIMLTAEEEEDEATIQDWN
ncbi:MAG: glutamyl-tRNA reductase [Thermodesulfobacteriota bacterium]